MIKTFCNILSNIPHTVIENSTTTKFLVLAHIFDAEGKSTVRLSNGTETPRYEQEHYCLYSTEVQGITGTFTHASINNYMEKQIKSDRYSIEQKRKSIDANSSMLNKQELEYHKTFDYKRKQILEDSMRDIKKNILKDSNSIDIKKTSMESFMKNFETYKKNAMFVDNIDLDGNPREQYIVLSDKVLVPFNNNPASIFVENKKGTRYINDPKYARLMQSIVERARTLPREYRIPHNSSYDSNENST